MNSSVLKKCTIYNSINVLISELNFILKVVCIAIGHELWLPKTYVNLGLYIIFYVKLFITSTIFVGKKKTFLKTFDKSMFQCNNPSAALRLSHPNLQFWTRGVCVISVSSLYIAVSWTDGLKEPFSTSPFSLEIWYWVLPLRTVCVVVTVWFNLELNLSWWPGHCAYLWVFLSSLSVILLSYLLACFLCLRSVRRGHVYPECTKAKKDRFSHKALLPRPFQSSLSISLSYPIRAPDLW